MPIELFIATFEEDEQAAGQALKRIQELDKQEALELEDAAVVVRTETGEVQVADPGDIDPKRARLVGAVTGGLIGLIGGPVGAIAGAIVGGTGGNVASKLLDYGVSDELIESVEKGLQPGSSAIIAYVQLTWIEEAIARLEERGATVSHATLYPENVDDLL